jgi:hypothetical protein
MVARFIAHSISPSGEYGDESLRVVGAEALKATVLRAVAPYRTSTGGVRLQNHFRYVVATPHDDGQSTR